MEWKDPELTAAIRYWIERFCDRYGVPGEIKLLYPSVTTIIFPGPGGGVKQVDLDHQLLRDQMVQVSEQRAKEILESWLEFSIGNPDPLQAAQYNEQDRAYFTGLEAAAQKFRVWALEKEE